MVHDQVYNVWQWLVRLTKQRKEELHVWAVSSSCSWNCIIRQWAHLAYIVLQLLIGLAQLLRELESPNKDSKSPNKDHLYYIFSLTPNMVHPLIRNIYISISSSGYHLLWGFPLARVSLVNKIWCHELSLCIVTIIV